MRGHNKSSKDEFPWISGDHYCGFFIQDTRIWFAGSRDPKIQVVGVGRIDPLTQLGWVMFFSRNCYREPLSKSRSFCVWVLFHFIIFLILFFFFFWICFMVWLRLWLQLLAPMVSVTVVTGDGECQSWWRMPELAVVGEFDFIALIPCSHEVCLGLINLS